MIQNEELITQQAIKHKVLLDAKNDLKKTFEDIGEEINMSEATVKNIVTGTTKNPQILSLAPICKALNVTIEEVVYGYKEKKSVELQEPMSDASVIEFCKMQIKSMEESHKKQMEDQKALYEQIIKELKESHTKAENHFEKRLTDKREHIDTILLDKKWFRLAAVVGVLAVFGLFIFIEAVTPGHGWFQH